MKKSMKILVLLLIAVSPIFGQNEAAVLKFDEIANVPNYYCDDCEPKVKVRVERFASYLRKNGRGKQVFIIHYRARILEEDKKHRLGNWVNTATWQLANSPVGHENVFVIDGGIREFDTLELWLAPKGSSVPTPTPKYTRAEAINCPSIYVFQSGMAFDRTIQFKASIRPDGNYGYEWSVDKGKIENGSSNDFVKVELDEKAGGKVTAFLKMSGVPVPCKNTFNAVGEAGNTPKLVDEFGKITDGDFKARVDGFYILLANYPEMQGYVYFYGDRKESSMDIRKNRLRWVKYIAGRRFDPARVTVVEAGFKESVLGEFWLVPAGVPPPKPTPSVDQQFVIRPGKVTKKT